MSQRRTAVCTATVQDCSVPHAFHLCRPNVARMCDYLLGGENNILADREAVREAIERAPNLRLIVEESRFLQRAAEASRG